MLDALGEWMTYPMLRHAYAGSPPPRVADAASGDRAVWRRTGPRTAR